jgi:hypothetical protein
LTDESTFQAPSVACVIAFPNSVWVVSAIKLASLIVAPEGFTCTLKERTEKIESVPNRLQESLIRRPGFLELASTGVIRMSAANTPPTPRL